MAYTTINDPTAYFQNLIWSGNNSDNRALTFDGNSNLQADMTWFKGRTIATNHQLIDSVRGVTKQIKPDISNAEATDSTVFKSFNSNGITIGVGGVVNDSGQTYCSWNWKAGTSFTNDASSTGIGTIDSTGSANDTAGFSIVTYTGNGTSGATVKHGLSSALGMLIVKSRSEARNWSVFHQSNGGTKNLSLDTTDAVEVNAARWNNTAPTSSVFTLGNSTPVNNNGITYVAYCFAEKQGYSKFGSYTGNGSTDGTFVYTGFKPAFVLQKNASATQGWQLQDNKRNGFNGANKLLQPNDSAAESDVNRIDILSNGFKVITTDAGQNTSGASYIYMCFASNPLVTSTGVPATAR